MLSLSGGRARDERNSDRVLSCHGLGADYTKAAEFLNLSQPTVNRYIAGLEEELQCRLLHRTTKKVEMTE